MKKDCIVDVTRYFNRNKKKEWFNQAQVKEIIKGIDNTIAVKDEYLESPVFGGMSPDRLSTGCKAVILMEVLDGCNVYATKCGDNCVPYILDIASRKEVTITLHHAMLFPKDLKAYVIETDTHVHTRQEFYENYYTYRKHKAEEQEVFDV